MDEPMMKDTALCAVSSIMYSAAMLLGGSPSAIATPLSTGAFSTPVVMIAPASSDSGLSMKSRIVTAGKPRMLASSLIVPLSDSTSLASC